MLPSLQLAGCEAADGLLCLFRHPSSSSSCWKLRWCCWGRHHPTSHHHSWPSSSANCSSSPAHWGCSGNKRQSSHTSKNKKHRIAKPSAMDLDCLLMSHLHMKQYRCKPWCCLNCLNCCCFYRPARVEIWIIWSVTSPRAPSSNNVCQPVCPSVSFMLHLTLTSKPKGNPLPGTWP